MTRTEHLIKLILSALSEQDLPRSAVTNKIKNYEADARHSAVYDCVEQGYVRFYSDAPGGKGRTAVIVQLTEKGQAKLDSMRGKFGDISNWSRP